VHFIPCLRFTWPLHGANERRERERETDTNYAKHVSKVLPLARSSSFLFFFAIQKDEKRRREQDSGTVCNAVWSVS
jgi:hypothetical protein